MHGVGFGSGTSKGCASSVYTSSESPQAQPEIDDDAYARNHTQIKEKAIKEKDLKPETRAWVRSRILSRAGCRIRNVHAFLRAAIPDFLENLESEVEEYLTLIAVACMREKLERRDGTGFDDVLPVLREGAEKDALTRSEAFFNLDYESAADVLHLEDADNPVESQEDEGDNRKLAELADLHRNYVGGVERGERKIGLLNIVARAQALKLKPAKLLEFVP